MAVMNVNPTRMQLTKLKKQLVTAIRGHKMLKDKRDELMRRFLEMIKETGELRAFVEEQLKQCNGAFDNAAAVMSNSALDTALLSPAKKVEIETLSENIMSVDIPTYNERAFSQREKNILPYGYAFTSFELDSAVEQLEKLKPHLIKLAFLEKSCELLSSEIEKAGRRVNSLEHTLIPRYKDTIRFITMKLEENDRSSRTRLMKVKDMLLKEAHSYED